MLRNFLLVAWRHLARSKTFSLINIFGLATGISVCLLIFLYVAHESSFDKFHKNAARIYSIQAKVKTDKDSLLLPNMSFLTGPLAKEADPSIESFLRMKIQQKKVIIQNAESMTVKYLEKNFLFADSNFFSFFSFRLKEGDPARVLARPFTVVISERAAKKYFNHADPVGKMLRYDSASVFEVTGVAEDPPSNSSLDFDFIGSISTMASMKEYKSLFELNDVRPGSFKTYFLLGAGSVTSKDERIIQSISGLKDKNNRDQASYQFTSLLDAHLHTGGNETSSPKYLKLISMVAGLILLLALINYISLATARATTRAREIGVRKVLGASRSSISLQFYLESFLYSFIAFCIGTILFVVLRPYFLNLLHLQIDTSFLFAPVIIKTTIVLLLVTIVVAGSYPSLLLSSFKPQAVLYGKLSKQKAGASIRKIFTTFQFIISISLIISSIVINRQLFFLQHTDTGVTRENIVMVPFTKNISQHYRAFRKDIGELAGVNQIATANYPMYGGHDIYYTKAKDKSDNIALPILNVDEQFITLLNLQWQLRPEDTRSLAGDNIAVINESTIAKLNLPLNPVGEKINIGGYDNQIAGVLKDFNFESLYNRVDALCIFVNADTSLTWLSGTPGCLFAKAGPHTDMKKFLASTKNIFLNYEKNTPFEYQLMDDAFNAMYETENRLVKLINDFTIFTICIAALGLFGLTAFSATQRVKETGIRMVLGASKKSIVGLFIKEIILLVIIAAMIAIPVTWFILGRWLEGFAYRTSMTIWVFIWCSLLSLLLSVAIVSLIAFKAALAKPVQSLRSD